VKKEASEKFWSRKNPIMWGTMITALFFAFLISLGVQSHCEPSLVKQSHCPTKFGHFLSSPPNEIGDTLAGIAGALAFLWIIVTVMLQSQELKAQRLELKAQKEELSLSRIESEKMNETMANQLFENTFFEMVSTYNSIVNAIDVTYTEPGPNWFEEDNPDVTIVKTGRDSFEHFRKKLKRNFDILDRKSENEVPVNEFYRIFWRQFQNDLGHYFRFLYRAFKFISENPSAKEHHAKILRSLLSDLELVMLFYNCTSEHGEKFRKYAIEFELFDNLPTDMLFDPLHIQLINPKSFGKNIPIQATNP